MIRLSREELKVFNKLSSKRKYRFWQSEPSLMSDRARYIISTPHLAEQLINEIRKVKRNKTKV